MLTYNMDVTPESIWKRTTLSEAERAQSYSCTEAGLFYAQQDVYKRQMHFMILLVRAVGQVMQMKDACSWPLAGALLVLCPSRAYSSQMCIRDRLQIVIGARCVGLEPLQMVVLPDQRHRQIAQHGICLLYTSRPDRSGT